MLSIFSNLARASVTAPPPTATVPPSSKNPELNPMEVRNRLAPNRISDRRFGPALPPITTESGKQLHRVSSKFKSIEGIERRFDVSVQSPSLELLGRNKVGDMEKAFAEGKFALERNYGASDDRDGIMRVKVSKNIGNIRSELAHRHGLEHPFSVSSIYSFRVLNEQAADNVLIWQVKETGGGMDGKFPSVAIHLQKNSRLVLKWNASSPEGMVRKHFILGNASPGAWHDFRIKLVWDRDKPMIQVMLDGVTVFLANERFGARNSANHYSKFGAYVPSQDRTKGTQDTYLKFDSYREIHRALT